MAAKLIIRFRPDTEDEEVDWLIFSSGGGIQEGKSSLNEIPWVEDLFVLVLVPTLKIVLTQVEIPKMKPARLRAALPYVIEEYLTSDLSDVHIAVSNFYEEGKLSVVVVQHTLMKGWLKKLADAGISPDVLLPDIWYLPIDEGAWTLWVESEYVLVKIGKHEGFAVDLKNLKMMLDLKWKEFEQTDKKRPEKINVLFSDQASKDLFNETFEKDHEYQLNEIESSSSFLSTVPKQLLIKDSFNLLQPPYEVKKKWGKLKKKWFPVVVLWVAWLCLFLFKELFEYFYLSRQVVDLKRQTLSAYQEILPGITDLDAGRIRLQKELDRTLLAAKGNPLFKKLNQVIPALKSSPVLLTGFDYKNHVLILNVEADRIQTLNALVQTLKAKRILVEPKNTSQQKGKVTSQLRVKT